MFLLIVSCSKRSVLRCFPSTRKPKAGVFKFLRFEERFRKAPFSGRLLWTVGLTVEIKLYAFLNSSGVVWTEHVWRVKFPRCSVDEALTWFCVLLLCRMKRTSGWRFISTNTSWSFWNQFQKSRLFYFCVGKQIFAELLKIPDHHIFIYWTVLSWVTVLPVELLLA